MRNGLRFASISHGVKQKFKRKMDTLAPCSVIATKMNLFTIR
jgi:hypothetical protein